MPNKQELHEIFRRLAEPFPETAIERTRSDVTHKGYDTSGIKYQFVVNRLNEVLGVGGYKVEREFSVREKESRSGGILFDVTCDLVLQLGEWQDGRFVPFAEATGTGGHVASSEADAKKGSFTNGFKKTAAMLGCGWQAYAGVIDDDNVPQPVRDAEERRRDHEERRPEPRASQERHEGGASRPQGRITNAQLSKLRELVDESGRNWATFRTEVEDRHNVQVEYASVKLASQLIDELLSAVRSRRGRNGNGGRQNGNGIYTEEGRR